MRQRLTALLQEQSLRGASLRSGAWTFFGFGLQAVLRLGSNLILTRILAPEMFGLMSLALVFVLGVSLMSDLGTKHSVIRSSRGEDTDFLASAWTIQVLRGAFVTLLACALAWPAAQAYGQPELFVVLCVLSLMAVIDGFNSISMATTSRNMELGRQTLITLASQILSIALMIGFAIVLESVWALVIGTLAASALKTLLSHLLLTPFKHRFVLERAAVREIIGFGQWVLLSTMFTFIGGRGITAVHGALVPLDILGVLAVSTTLIRALEDLIAKLLAAVAFPAFSKVIRENLEDLPTMLNRVRNRFLTVCVIGFCGVSMIAQPLIDFLYDPRYALAGSILAIQALNGALRIMAAPYQEVLLALGNSRLHAAVMFCSAAAGILGTIAGFYFYDVFGMIAGMGVGALLAFGLSASFAWRRGYANLTLDFTIILAILFLYAHTLLRLSSAA
ncbi:MAG: oligosaccharide flippase family protein [Pseudomonadota bacterium]